MEISNLENPRPELEEHYYNPDRKHLIELGYQPTHDVDTEICRMLEDLLRCRERVEAKKDILTPAVRWDGRRESVKALSVAGD